MDSERIEQLLEKYWNAETSLAEERELHHYFQQPEVSENLKSSALLFHYFEKEKSQSLDDKFDAAVTNKIQQRRDKKSMITRWFQPLRIAAGVSVLVATAYLIDHNMRQSTPTEMADTESDPKLAFEETKKALLMISENFGQAKQEVRHINLINEAERKESEHLKNEY